MKRLNTKTLLALYLIALPLVSYAIDPLGSKVDFDNDYNNNLSSGGFLLLIAIIIIGSVIYPFSLKYSNHQENKSTNKQTPKDSSEWINEEYANKIDRLIKEEQEGKKGCIFFILLLLGGFAWSVIDTDTNWLEAGKDLLVILGGGGILIGICLLISYFSRD